MLKKVFVNGYGSIGSRIIQFINDDPEIEVLGVGKYSPDSKINEAISNGYSAVSYTHLTLPTNREV